MKRAWINVGIGVGCVTLLLSLLIPLMLELREDARRSQCKNNLKQWGLALLNYHDSFNVFPPYAGGTHENSERLSGRVMLMNYLDANPVWDEIKTSPGQGGDPLKLRPRSLPDEIPVFVCPSSRIPPSVDRQPHASYAFCAGDQLDFGDEGGVKDFPNRMKTRGVFGWRQGIRIQDIFDGTSNTIAMAERDLGTTSASRDARGRVAKVAATSPADCINLTSNGRYLASVPLIPEWMGERWASGHPFYSVFLTAVPPNGPSCAESAPPSGSSVGGWFTASSRHPGGCHVLLCDGYVRFINNDINHETYRSDGLRATKPVDRAIDFGKDDPRRNHHDTSSSYGIWGQLGTINDAIPWAY